MPSGRDDIKEDGIKFSSEYQPKNRRKSTKFLTELLTKSLKKKTEIIIEGVDVNTGLLTKVKVQSPTKETIVLALLRQAAKGNTMAIKEIFDRIEGKALQSVEVDAEVITMLDLSKLPIVFK